MDADRWTLALLIGIVALITFHLYLNEQVLEAMQGRLNVLEAAVNELADVVLTQRARAAAETPKPKPTTRRRTDD